MPLNESDTRSKLIDPAIHNCGWTEDLVRREETAGAVVAPPPEAADRDNWILCCSDCSVETVVTVQLPAGVAVPVYEIVGWRD